MKRNSIIFTSLLGLLLSFQQLSVATPTHSPLLRQADPHKSIHKKATKSDAITQRSTRSETLPEYLPRKLFLQHIADGLGWVPSTTPCSLCLLCNGYFKEPDIVRLNPHVLSYKKEPAIITAKGESTIDTHGTSFLEKNVVVTQPGRIVEADKAYIYRDKKTGHIAKILLIGHVRLMEAGKLIIADRGTLTLYPRTATLINTAYHLHGDKPYTHTLQGPYNSWGTAQYAHRDKNNIITLKHATYSTCSPTNPSWQIRASKIILDRPIHEGRAYNALIRLAGLPIFYTPYYFFPLDHKRKTGFLTPKLGYNSQSGGDFAFPFYWNMAPNYDLTLTPEYLTQRNFELGSLFRYMNDRSLGKIYFSFLPYDSSFTGSRNIAYSTYNNAQLYDQTFFAPYLNQLNQFNNTRGFFSLNNVTDINHDWVTHINGNYVTDPYFFQDLGNKLDAATNSDQLLNQIDLQYSGWHWEFASMVQAFQTLHSINQTLNPALDQYTRLPDLSAQAYYPVGQHFDYYMDTEFVDFTYQSLFTPDKPIGQRLHLRPGIGTPIYFSDGYILPQIWGDMTAYEVEHVQSSQVTSANRILPIFDVDTNLYFDRQFSIKDHHYTQTFEPRMMYLYIPYQNQDRLPNFDTVLLPFSLQQLFALNGYTGDDRLTNTNQISLDLGSRFLNDDTGATFLVGHVGFIYYIDNNRVCLSAGCAQPVYRFSPIVGSLGYYPATQWSIGGTWAWDPNLRQTNNASASITYAQDSRHTFSMGYSFVHADGASISPWILTIPTNIYSNNTSEFTFAATWPLTDNWSTAGGLSYNLVHRRMDSFTATVQYDACCWALRLISQYGYAGSVVNSSGHISNRYNAVYFVQLELKGLGDLGTKITPNYETYENYIYAVPNFVETHFMQH